MSDKQHMQVVGVMYHEDAGLWQLWIEAMDGDLVAVSAHAEQDQADAAMEILRTAFQAHVLYGTAMIGLLHRLSPLPTQEIPAAQQQHMRQMIADARQKQQTSFSSPAGPVVPAA